MTKLQVSEKAQQQLRVLLTKADVLLQKIIAKERKSSEAFIPSPAVTQVALDLYALGFEAFQATDLSIFHWADGFEGTLYSLTHAVTEALQVCNPQQVKLLRKLDIVVTRIDEWHTAFIAVDTSYVVEAEECPPECIFHPDHPGLVYAK